MRHVIIGILLCFLFVNISSAQDCQWDRFKADTDSSTPEGKALEDAMDDNPDLIDSWGVLDDSGFSSSIKQQPDNLEAVDRYLKSTGDTKDNLSQIIEGTTPENQQKWVDVLGEINFSVNTKVTGDFETKELKQALSFGKEQGGGTLDFPNSAQGIEGVLVKGNGEKVPVSFKELTTDNKKNVFRSINTNSGQIKGAQMNDPNSLAAQFVNIGEEPNTHIHVNAENVSSSDILEYYNSIPEDRRLNLFGEPGVFKEIKIFTSDSKVVLFRNYVLIE